MKKLWRKFKHWLIKKLGGIPDEPSLYPSMGFNAHTPIAIKAVVNYVDKNAYENDPEYRSAVRVQLQYILSEQVYRAPNTIKYETTQQWHNISDDDEELLKVMATVVILPVIEEGA